MTTYQASLGRCGIVFKLKKPLIILLSVIGLLVISITISFAQNQPLYNDAVTTSSVIPVDATLKSNRYTQVDDLSTIDENPYVTINNHEFIGTHTDTGLSLYVHPEHLSLRIVNENTGYIWGSNMDHDYLEEGHPLYESNNPQTNIRQDISPVSISYFNTSQITSVRLNEYFYEGAFNGTFTRRELTDQTGFSARIKMPRSGIMFELIVYLNDEGLNIEVPFDSIEDNGNFIISTITIYRNFGFTTKDVTPGYAFIPDGVGALIRYDGTYNKNYSKKFYGPDLTLTSPSLERYLTAGLYGTVQGIHQNAMMVILNKGAAHGTLTYQSHNPNVLFNKLYTTFEYRDKYIQKLNASGTSTIERIQTDKNRFDIHFIYKFLSGENASYVGFSHVYREYLKKNGNQLEPLPTKDYIDLHLDILALESKSAWYGRASISMTNTTQINDITTNLQTNGIEHIVTTIHGWQSSGLSRTTPNFGRIDGAFGKIAQLDNPNVETYYATTPLLGYPGASGYQANDIVRNQGSEFIEVGNHYLLNPQDALDILNKNYERIHTKGIKNLSFEVMNLLYSDYHQRLSRSESMEIIEQFLNIANRTIVSQPFDYLFGADIIKELEMYSSQRIDFTDTVPFLPLILSGHKLVFGRSANFFANTQNELLRMIDYQIYPNFYVTHESAGLLLNTDSNNIFTSKFSDWQPEIIRQYNYLNDALKFVTGSYIESRVVIEPGFVQNTYSNGVVIYINYSGHAYTANGVTVPMMSYEVVL